MTSNYETVGQRLDFHRNHQDRPWIKTPQGDITTYTRVTNHISVLEDTFNLGRYQQRNVARGLALRDDLRLKVGSKGPEPDKNADYNVWRQWKDAMDELCDEAREAAEESKGRNLGDALHTYTELVDLGLEPTVPDDFRRHIDNYRRVVAGLGELAYVEVKGVNDQLQVAGTADRIYRNPDGRHVVGDLKTGSLYGLGKMRMQKAVYAHSLRYEAAYEEVKAKKDADFSTKNGHWRITRCDRIPYEDMDLDRAVIIHLNAKSGDCEPIWVDIADAWYYASEVCNLVKAYRAQTHHDHPPAPKQRKEPPTEFSIWQALAKAKTEDDLVAIWLEAAQHKRWTQAMTVRAAERKQQLQAKAEA